jgi:hypothetical protein
MNVRGGHFLKEDIELFDTSFFNISPNEANAIDPQQRLQLESAYEALESGAYVIFCQRAETKDLQLALQSNVWLVATLQFMQESLTEIIRRYLLLSPRLVLHAKPLAMAKPSCPTVSPTSLT